MSSYHQPPQSIHQASTLQPLNNRKLVSREGACQGMQGAVRPGFGVLTTGRFLFLTPCGNCGGGFFLGLFWGGVCVGVVGVRYLVCWISKHGVGFGGFSMVSATCSVFEELDCFAAAGGRGGRRWIGKGRMGRGCCVTISGSLVRQIGRTKAGGDTIVHVRRGFPV